MPTALGRSAVAPGVSLQAALDALVPQLDHIQDEKLSLSAACCCCQLGQLREAKTWLGSVFRMANGKGRLDQTLLKALDDPDQEPMWREVGSLGS